MTPRIDIPTLSCRRGSPAAGDDGRAEATSAFHVLRQTADDALQPAEHKTTLRCLWDDEHLHLAFDCIGPGTWATKTRRDDELWEENVAEVFLDVEGEGRSFFEFQVNPLRTIYDSFVPDAVLSEDWPRWSRWNCEGLTVAVQVDDAGWQARFAIPLASLARHIGQPPKAGDAWRVNFCRYNYDAPGVEPELSCWAPTVAVYDDLPRFGVLRFA